MDAVGPQKSRLALCYQCQEVFQRDREQIFGPRGHPRQSHNLSSILLSLRPFISEELENARSAGCIICTGILSGSYNLYKPSPASWIEYGVPEEMIKDTSLEALLRSRGSSQLNEPPPLSFEKSGLFIVTVCFYTPAQGSAYPHQLRRAAYELRPERDVEPLTRQDTVFRDIVPIWPMDIAREWIHKCSKNHPICNVDRSQKRWHPRRLLDLGVPTDPQAPPRLRVFDDQTQDISYTTLSYRWGGARIMKLTRDTINTWQQILPLYLLARSIQDAASMTRTLGIRYLWVDSICIIQDDPNDWRAQSAEMGDIYRHGICNLAATRSFDPTRGFGTEIGTFHRSPSMVNVRLTGLVPPGVYHIYNADSWQMDVMSRPLNNRGWVLQERLLAPRTLHFATQLYWECGQLKANEMYPGGLPTRAVYRLSKYMGHLLSLPEPQKLLGAGLPPNSQRDPAFIAERYERWCKVISSYSACELTRAEDKLVALSGLASHVQHLTGDEYLAGLWRQTILYDLLWMKSSNPTNSEMMTYRAPTWSWAALDGPVMHIAVDREMVISSTPVSTLVAINVEPAGDSKTGQIKSASITFEGPVLPAKWTKNSQATHAGTVQLELAGTSVSNSNTIFDNHSRDTQTGYCLPLLKSDSTRAFLGLVLVASELSSQPQHIVKARSFQPGQPFHHIPTVCQRIGMFRCAISDFARHDIEGFRTEVTLV